MIQPPPIPWISGESVGNFFHGVWNIIKGLFHALTGTGDSLVTIAGLPLRGLDIWLVIIVAGVITFASVYNGKYHALVAQRDEKYRTMFLKPTVTEVKNNRWEHITHMIRSENPADWRIAIIEADTMLEEFLTMLGYPGAGVGEKLKSATKQNFPTLDDAWEAHKVRNQIAHGGLNYRLDQREALHVYYLYERVFKDANYI